MTPQVEKEFKLELFISDIICDQLKRLIYEKNISPYLKFLTLPQYIEFLGACTDEKDFIDEKESKNRFNKIMRTYFKNENKKYLTYSNGNHSKWDLYKDFRCGVIHQLRPVNKVVFTTRSEAKLAENTHLELDKESNEMLVLILEDIYDDIEKVAKHIINEYKTNQFTKKTNDKWLASHIMIYNDGDK